MRLSTFAMTGCLLFMSAMASAAAADQKPMHRVIPVLVSVDSHAKVGDISPAYQLSPGFQSMLRSTLQQMIKKPAMDHGKPISSQFVITLAMDAVQQADGQYNAKFSYVSSKPLPSGQWYWVHEEHGRLALADRSMRLPQIQAPLPPAEWHPRAEPVAPPPGGGKQGY